MARPRRDRRLPIDYGMEIPSFDDHEAVYQLFAPSVVFEDLEEMYEPEPKPAKQAGMKSPAFEQEIIRLAGQGRTDEIAKLAQARLEKPKGGREKMTDAERWRSVPTHRAARIRGMVKGVLEELYPDRRIDETNERALLIAVRMWNDESKSPAAGQRGMKIQAATLRDYLRRPGSRRLF